MVTNADRILEALRTHGPLSDGELLELTGVRPHQQVNQICRGLERSGVLTRQPGPTGRIVNVLAATATQQAPPMRRWFAHKRTPHTPAPSPREDAQPAPAREPGLHLDCSDALFVIPCSGAKATGGEPALSGARITELLPQKLAERLFDAREGLQARSGLDESRLMPASQRYSGTLYTASASALREHDAPMVILSGGYGIVLADEPIGVYDQEFKLSRWPLGLLQDCLLAVCESLGVRRVRAFCATTTGYGELVRSVRWPKGTDACLISPDMEGRGGAQVLVPRALGQALAAGLADQLDIPMVSSDGIPVNARQLSGS